MAGWVGCPSIRPRRRSRYLLADRAYDHPPQRQALARLGATAIIARRGAPHGTGLGWYRWPVDPTLSWLGQHCRLRTRWDRCANLHHAFLACSIICLRRLHSSL